VSEGAAKKEEKPRKFQAIRGTRDLLPPETALWNRVEQTAHQVFATFGFGEIRVPTIETLGLFARSLGPETDIVGKEMFLLAEREPSVVVHPGRFGPPPQTEQDRRDEVERVFSQPSMRESVERQIEESVLVLRPEATASVCRAYIENNMQQLPQPVKLYYMGPMFRRERPQKGRYRQFYQIGAEVLGGSDAPAIDAEVIEMVMMFFDRLELQGVQLDINSIGDRNCRPKYVELLSAELLKVKDKLGPDSQRRIETNPLRVLDSKLESEQEIIAKLPRIADHLCEECAAHYAAVKHQLEMRGVIYRENWRLVRGLDYYMRSTFEITAQGLGSQNAVCGGGRYDGLVELLGGPPTKGIGFAIGEDRLILSLQESGEGPVQRGRDVYIAWMGERAQATAIRAAKDLRKAGFSVELPPVEQKFGKALGQADKLGAKFALILGDNEVCEGLWTLKTLADGSQAKFTEPDLLEHLNKQRALKL
jgi:histidyl-tRNA synthetase